MSLTFKNECGMSVSVCIAYYDPKKCPDIKWAKAGWWNIANRKSVTVISGNLNNRYYYFYAVAANGSEWNGPRSLSVWKKPFNMCLDYILLDPIFVGIREIDTGGYSNVEVTLKYRKRTKSQN